MSLCEMEWMEKERAGGGSVRPEPVIGGVQIHEADAFFHLVDGQGAGRFIAVIGQ
jgi:hypothetical protein